MTSSPPLRCGIVVRVREDGCEIVSKQRIVEARYATSFPAPRTERVSPGHLVALASTSDGQDVVVGRWYDAVVLGENGGLIRLWEPAHGEVVARPRDSWSAVPAGARAYVSAGLPGADWWVTGPAVARAEDAVVDLDQLRRLYTEHDLWETIQDASVLRHKFVTSFEPLKRRSAALSSDYRPRPAHLLRLAAHHFSGPTDATHF